MLRTNIPIGESQFYFGLSNEVLISFGKNVAGNRFDQNRDYAALGRNMGHQKRLETGLMEQTLHRRGGVIREHNHTLQVAVYSRLPFGKR